jgi:IPT/TIG domain
VSINHKLIKLIGVILPLLVLFGCQPELEEGTPISISLVYPNKGPLEGGQEITIYGEGLGFVDSVTLGGSDCTELVIIDSTEIKCTTPPGDAGPVNISIIGKARKTGLKADGYTYQDPPVVSSVSPTVGFASGGLLITITGTGFIDNEEEPISVKIGGAPCLNINLVDSTTIECTTPVRSAGLKSIIITNFDGQSATLANSFTFNAAPKVTSITPSGGALAGGTSVTIVGSGFKLNDTAISIGGFPCLPLTFNSATNLTCTTTGPSSGVKSVVATNLDTQTGSLANAFTYQAGPVISSISKDSGALAGGTNVTITGTGFLIGATVKVGANSCQGNGYLGATSYFCSTPAGAAGTVDIQFINPDGQEFTLSSAYTYRPAPVITSVTPNVLPVTLGGEITIAGSNFVAGATVKLGTTPCPVSSLTSTSITCDAPLVAEAAVLSVYVTNPDEQMGNKTNALTYRAAPTISAISPEEGPTTGGTEITITGTGFMEDPVVTIGGLSCLNIQFISATSVKCNVPAGTSGSKTIILENSDAQSVALANAYTYYTPANLEWDITNHDYGGVTINSSQIFTLTNTGEQSTSSISVALTGTNASAWSLTLGAGNSCSGVVLEEGESCIVEATFLGATSAAGDYEADLGASATTGGNPTSSLSATRDP